MLNINNIDETVERKAELYLKKYGDYIHHLEHSSPLSKIRTITKYDVYALGKMLESFDTMVKMMESDGSVSDLGVIPKIAYDVLTVVFGTSPVAMVASVQPIEEEQGSVYFKDIVAGDTLGNIIRGDKILSPVSAPTAVPSAYAGQAITESEGNTNSGVKSYSGTVTGFPIRPYTVTFNIATPTPIVGKDDGNGNILGVGIYGVINYTTGAYTINLVDAPTATYRITVTYYRNLEGSPNISSINSELSSKGVLAEVFALRTPIGMLKSFALRKRFGQVAEDEAAIELTNAINTEIFASLLRKMNVSKVGNTQWAKTPSQGVSYFEHKQSLKDALAMAEGTMVANAGRGTISFIIAGTVLASIISTLPGWSKLYDGTSSAIAHLYGTLDGVPVVRVNVSEPIGSPNRGILGYKGVSAFDASSIFAPYMPLTVTSVLPTANPLVSQRAAAVWAAVDVVVPKLLTGFEVTD